MWTISLFNYIYAILASLYICILYYEIIDLNENGIMLGVLKALPVWMCAVLSMISNDSVVGVAMVFGSAGDFMFALMAAKQFMNDKEFTDQLFLFGVGLFMVQHFIMIWQFTIRLLDKIEMQQKVDHGRNGNSFCCSWMMKLVFCLMMYGSIFAYFFYQKYFVAEIHANMNENKSPDIFAISYAIIIVTCFNLCLLNVRFDDWGVVISHWKYAFGFGFDSGTDVCITVEVFEQYCNIFNFYGYFMFMVSDSMIGLLVFGVIVDSKKITDVGIMSLYYLAQVFFANGSRVLNQKSIHNHLHKSK